MITMNREIHPVGQGAFYTESFNFYNEQTFNMVYDCGTYWEGSCKRMNYKGKSFTDILDTYLQSVDKKIDYIFVSHFHADHINGIKYLIDKADKRQDIRIVMPWMSKNLKFFLYIADMIESEEKVQRDNQFLFDLLIGQDNYSIIEVADEEKKQSSRRVILNGRPISIDGMGIIWEYIPVSFIYPELNGLADAFVKHINERFEDKCIQLVDYANMKMLIHEHWEDIVIIYKESKTQYPNVNENNMSLMLYSGSIFPYCLCRNVFNGLTPCWSSSVFIEAIKRDSNGRHLNGCIYVGDMERKEAFEELKMIGNRFGNVGIIQLSHHGDENGMNEKLIEINSPYAFCCFGSNNKNHHPGLEDY